MAGKKYQPYSSKYFVFETTSIDSYRLSKVRSKNTKPEIALRKELWSKGIRYRKNFVQLPGKPDIVIKKWKIAIFVDGEFWHGYNWVEMKKRFKTNREYWIPKIENNMLRDLKNNDELTQMGFTVIRFWEAEIKKNISDCVMKILSITEKIKSENNDEQ